MGGKEQRLAYLVSSLHVKIETENNFSKHCALQLKTTQSILFRKNIVRSDIYVKFTVILNKLKNQNQYATGI